MRTKKETNPVLVIEVKNKAISPHYKKALLSTLAVAAEVVERFFHQVLCLAALATKTSYHLEYGPLAMVVAMAVLVGFLRDHRIWAAVCTSGQDIQFLDLASLVVV
jgi:hypothetical protein